MGCKTRSKIPKVHGRYLAQDMRKLHQLDSKGKESQKIELNQCNMFYTV